ncbi:hypothetical protein DL764_003057 [Monosporascus ibericus]|uniref:Uncharacterized protein n=1 Tax=Monosporascus ibericus TaxID=155417 RepID=A0A4Q4TI32_9PEZI|nr:hypothetical protein DL764_003057 [Monosporascus ibericus]
MNGTTSTFERCTQINSDLWAAGCLRHETERTIIPHGAYSHVTTGARGLKEENRRLRDAIAKIGGAVSHSESALIEAIGDACRVAGVEAPHGIGEVEIWAEPPLGWTDWSISVDAETNHQGLVGQNSPGIEYPDQLVSNGDLDSVTGRDDTSENCGIEFGSGNSWSPNPIPLLTWAPERVLPLADPPPDIIPHLGASAYSLAEDAVATILDMFYATVRREKLPLIQNLLHARLQFRRSRYLDANTAHPAGRDPVVHALYPDQIVAELGRVGARKRDFLTPFDAAVRLRALLGEAEYPPSRPRCAVPRGEASMCRSCASWAA